MKKIFGPILIVGLLGHLSAYASGGEEPAAPKVLSSEPLSITETQNPGSAGDGSAATKAAVTHKAKPEIKVLSIEQTVRLSVPFEGGETLSCSVPMDGLLAAPQQMYKLDNLGCVDEKNHLKTASVVATKVSGDGLNYKVNAIVKDSTGLKEARTYETCVRLDQIKPSGSSRTIKLSASRSC